MLGKKDKGDGNEEFRFNLNTMNMNKEIWKDIQGYEEYYQVSNIRKGKIIR